MANITPLIRNNYDPVSFDKVILLSSYNIRVYLENRCFAINNRACNLIFDIIIMKQIMH